MTNTNADAWRERTPLSGAVDFTMMYVAHDAFMRDLRRLAAASEQRHAHSPRPLAGWAMFAKQLHIHHTAEDTSLWPRLRAAVSAPEEVAVLDAMEAEHAEIDPQLERVDAAIAARDAIGIVAAVDALTLGLARHMRHEEESALPLIERRLGTAGWAAFGRDVRRSQGGLRAGSDYLPWVLDGAPDATKARVLGLLPAPARLLYRRVWAPRYDRAVQDRTAGA
jgi:iron-sulfur cluster repair protein YtfE (RIC family)